MAEEKVEGWEPSLPPSLFRFSSSAHGRRFLHLGQTFGLAFVGVHSYPHSGLGQTRTSTCTVFRFSSKANLFLMEEERLIGLA